MTTAQSPPLPSPPFYTVPNINNLRDAALYPAATGLSTSSGGRIRTNILFRSAEVSRLDRPGWAAIKSIGIAHIFDLRSKPEVEKGWRGVTGEKEGAAGTEGDVRLGWTEGMEAEGLQRSWVPVFEEADYSPERLAERYLKYMGEGTEGFVQAYEDILRHAGPAFRSILMYLVGLEPSNASEGNTFLSNDPGAPAPSTDSPFAGRTGNEMGKGALVHCTAGKDRTGIFFGLLFSFLGVPREMIAEEYNLTETGLRHVQDEIVGRLMLSPGFKKFTLSKMEGGEMSAAEMARLIEQKGTHLGSEDKAGGDEQNVPPEVLEKGRQAALRMVGARKESMLGSLDMIDRVYGSAESYMRKECGLGDDELNRLRRNLVVEA
jgi:hypothetical protein